MIYILSGTIGTGKSYALMEWSRDRTDVFGVLSPRMEDEIRYFYDVKKKERFEMETTVITSNSISVGRYRFLKSAFDRANRIIQNSSKRTAKGYLIIDELGKLELRSEGVHKSAAIAIGKTKDHDLFHLILVVRTSLLEEIIKKYDVHTYEVINKHQLSEKLL